MCVSWLQDFCLHVYTHTHTHTHTHPISHISIICSVEFQSFDILQDEEVSCDHCRVREERERGGGGEL